jgi:hypothetical protein
MADPKETRDRLVESDYDGVTIFRNAGGNPKAVQAVAEIEASPEEFAEMFKQQLNKQLATEEKAVARDAGNSRRAAIMAQKERKGGS